MLQIGLEIHIRPRTEHKMFCGCSAVYGAPANTCYCPVCTGRTGEKRTLNPELLPLALRAGAALCCRFAPAMLFARRAYSAPDLPRGYQITQSEPFGTGGCFCGIPIREIHLEEDVARMTPAGTDLNRCGVALLEIVTEPVLTDGQAAADFARALRERMMALGITDGKMQEGALRADVNVSLDGGERVEIKNLNSFTNMRRAIDYEAARQKEARERGEVLIRHTRRYDEKSRSTQYTRDKMAAVWLPEEDFDPLPITGEMIEKAEKEAAPADK